MSQDRVPPLPGGLPAESDVRSSFALVLRARDGDEEARNELCARYLPRLRRWAHGRLPPWARERLDTVLAHMRSVGAHASGAHNRGSVLTVIADAVEDFKPDHVLLALRSAEHANWQERGLEKRLEKRFGLPLISYAVDPRGHATGARHP